MWDKVGLMRSEESLTEALARLREMQSRDLAEVALAPGEAHNATVEDWFELRSALMTAESIALAALNRRESRGAHQRLDHTETDRTYEKNQVISLSGNGLHTDWVPIVRCDFDFATTGEAA